MPLDQGKWVVGNVIVNLVPTPIVLVTSITPPCSSARDFAMANPRPTATRIFCCFYPIRSFDLVRLWFIPMVFIRAAMMTSGGVLVLLLAAGYGINVQILYR
jgi:hypothetical protein